MDGRQTARADNAGGRRQMARQADGAGGWRGRTAAAAPAAVLGRRRQPTYIVNKGVAICFHMFACLLVFFYIFVLFVF